MQEHFEVYVEKKPGLEIQSDALTRELNDSGLCRGRVRVINRYLMANLSKDEYRDSIYKVFADKNADQIYFSLEEAAQNNPYLITELLPGQFDMRANAAEECLQLIYGNFNAKVKFQTLIVFGEELTAEQRAAIRKTLINPVEMREGSLAAAFQDSLPDRNLPPVYAGFSKLDESGLKEFYDSRQLAMSLADLACIQEYFLAEGRDPNETELKVLDTYWSDHCRHTTFQTELTGVEFLPGTEQEEAAYQMYCALREKLGRASRPQTLMELATIGTKALKASGQVTDLDESEEINACSIIRSLRTEEGTEPTIIQFKNETHNHPTEIEPFGGAATCLGGAIRDPLAGRAYVYQAMRVTGAMDPTQDPAQTLAGKLPQKTISLQAARGYSSYGNQIGLAAGVVHEIYHPGYVAKRMEVGAVIGSAPVHSVVRKQPQAGDVVLLVGGRTGRDGVGGATGSSKSHDVTSMETSGAEVQKGNAPTERKLQRLLRNDAARRLIKRCNDFGAGGVSVAVGELAEGLAIDLDQVPLKYQGLTATETAVSESQERMAMVISPADLAEFTGYLDQENLESAVIATVTDDARLVMNWRGQTVVDLKRSFLDSAGASQYQAVAIEPAGLLPGEASGELTRERILTELDQLNNQSQKSLHELFDSTNGCATVTLPYGGRDQETEASHMAALIPVGDSISRDASVMTYGFDPFVSQADQFKGAYLAVVESLGKMAASGAGIDNARLSFQEYFQKLGNSAATWGKPMKSLLGALKAQLDFGTPAIGGKDSMSGTFGEIHVPPTLISFAVNTMPGERVLSNALKGSGILYQVVTTRADGYPEAPQLLAASRLIQAANEQNMILACDTTARGSVMTLLNMAWGNQAGMDVTLIKPYFERRPADFLLEIDPALEAQWLVLASSYDIQPQRLGTANPSGRLCLNGIELTAAETREAAHRRLSPVFRRSRKDGDAVENLAGPKVAPSDPAPAAMECPRVLITVFPGSNCEYDLARAFRKAGADPSVFVFRNRDQADIRQSVGDLAREIRRSQILMIPGGFSAGDEPDGSGKFIANVLRNPEIASAIQDLLEVRQGLILGICNGFQALVRLGLLPYGRIVEPREDMPMLASNEIGRHMDTISRVRVASNASPWLAYVRPGEVFSVPISHGEGRFMAPSDVLEQLKQNGQIITQYCDPSGNATMAQPHNPNGSLLAIEGIISPNGRVLGKMGHNERWQEGLFRNYPGEFDMKLFQAGVDYFRRK